MCDFPIALKKVRVNSGVSGKRIMDAVTQILKQYGDDGMDNYYQERRYENGDLYRIGRRGLKEKLNLLITTEGYEWFGLYRLYYDVEVVSLARTSDVRLCQSCDNKDVIGLVCNFAELLELELSKKT
ncbi:MAG: hypothetical protein H6797_03980 [Candidatus Nomurabacteria bacterium]|nr:MAG: hypothetical protein H6797_03980 [Candidatus Nomurabacteria bacterium]